jgi:enoyl-CoA hydratase
MQLTRFTLQIDEAHQVAQVRFNRPDKANAMDLAAWAEMRQLFDHLSAHPHVRAVVLAGQGKHFCAGIDLGLLADLRQQTAHPDAARARERLRDFVLQLQAPINALENCRPPVIAALHGACVGAGLDIASACDLRYTCPNATLAIKEIELGMVADLGTLQRLPRLMAPGLVAELAFTGRAITGSEAPAWGLANQCLPDEAALLAHATELARQIAAKSPLAIRGIKQMLRYTRDHSVPQGLDYVATWNAALLDSADLHEALAAAREKRPPVFPHN